MIKEDKMKDKIIEEIIETRREMAKLDRIINKKLYNKHTKYLNYPFIYRYVKGRPGDLGSQ